MASLNNIHLRIFLNSKDAVGSVHQLETALKELREQQRLLTEKGFEKASKEYKTLEKQVQNILSLQRQNRQVYTDIGKELEHINLLSLRQLKAMERQNNKAVNDLTRQGGDPKELARMREEAEQLRRAIAQYDLKQRDFAAAAKNITGQSADQRRVLVQQTLEWTNAQERGSRMARLGAEYYMKFADALAKANGQMGIGKAERIAGNTRSTQELKAMRRELEDLIALRTGSNTATPDFMRQSSVALNDINEAIKRSEPAKLRSLNDVLADIAKADTPVKLRVLKDELQQLRKAISAGGADNKAFQDTLRSAIASVTDPGTQTQLRDALNKMVVDGFTIDPTKVASMQNAVKAITNAFSNPAALSEAKAARQRLLDSIVDPKMAQRAADVLDTLFKNPINTANIDTARTSLTTLFGDILSQTKQITKVRAEVTSIFDGLADPRKIATIKSQMETMMNNITDPTHKARAQSAWDSLFAGPIDNNTLRLARSQFDQLFAEIGTTRTSEKAKESMDAIFKGLYEPKNIDSIKTTMATIEKAITDPILKTHVQTYFKEIFARPYDGANLTQYRQMFEQMLDAAGMKKKSAEVQKAMNEMFRVLANPQDAANVKASLSRIFAGLVSTDDVKKVQDGIRQVNAALRGMAPRDLEQIMKDGVSKGVNATLQQLRDSYASIKQVRDSLLPSLGASDPTIKQMDTELANVDARIVQLSRDIANKNVKASFADMQTALTVLKQRAEQLEPSTAKNIQLIADLKNEYRQLKKSVDDWGKETMTQAQAQQALASARSLISQGTNADATAVRHYVEQLRIAETVEGHTVAQVQEMVSARKMLTRLLSEETQVSMSATDASSAYGVAQTLIAQGSSASAVAVRQSVEAMKQAQQAEGITVKESQLYYATEKQLTDLLRGKAEVQMSATQAATAYTTAQRLIAQGSAADAAAVRQSIDAMKRAQQAEGISVRLAQEYNAAEKALTESLRGKYQVQMSAADAANAYASAQYLIAQGTTASATAVRQMIDLLKQAESAEGISVQQAQQYYAARKVLTDALQKEARATYTDTEAKNMLKSADALLEKGTKALVVDIEAMIESLKRLKSSTGATAQTSQDATQRIKALEQAMRGASSSAKDLVYDEKYVNDTMAQLKTAPINDLKKALEMVQQRMNETARDQKRFIEASNNYKKIKAQLDPITNSFKQQGDFISKAANKLMSYIGIFGGFYFVRQQLQSVFQANMKYDDSLTNIRKTTGLTTQAVEMLADNIKRIDTRTAFAEITDLAYAAGKLGVKGVSDLMGFVRAANQINIALGEQLKGAESVEQLYKIINIMGTNREFGMEDALLKTGSAINYITMNTQATAQPMVDFMKRTAGVATQAGMTTSELVGLAGAINALGQPVEMSATSISKMLVQMERHSDKVIKALRMSSQEAEQFVYNLSSGQASDALLMVLQKTREAGGLSHLGTIVKDLGSEGQRVIQTIATLSQNYETVSKMIRMSNEQFDLGTSVTNEYNIKNENTAALLERIKNGFAKLFTGPSAIEYFRQLLLAFQNFPQTVHNAVKNFDWLGNAIVNVAKFFNYCSNAVTAFLEALVLRAVMSFVGSLGLLVQDIKRTALGFRTAYQEAGGFFKYLKTASFGNIFTALATILLTVVNHFRTAAREARRMREESLELLQRTKEQSNETTSAINVLLQKLHDAYDNTDERNRIISELNSSYGEYLGNILAEAKSYDDVARAMEAVNSQMRIKALLDAKSEKEKEIKSENSGTIGASKLDLVQTIAQFIAGDDRTAARAAAANIAAYLTNINTKTNLPYAEQILQKSTNDRGEVEYGYSKFVIGGDNVAYNKASNTLQRLFQNILLQENQRSGANLSLVETQGMFNQNTLYGSVMGGLVDYLNNIEKQQNQIRESAIAFTDEMTVESRKSYDFYKDNADKYWKHISDVVTMDGALRDRLVGTDPNRPNEKSPWIARKDALKTDERVQEIDDLKQYILYANNLLTNMRAQGRQWVEGSNQTKETDEYRRLRFDILNAEEYLRVLNVGKIETMPEKGNKGSKQREAQDAYQNIIAKIKEFYEHQEEAYKRMMLQGELTATQYQQMLDQNAINLHDTLRQARLRILNRIDSGAWDEQIGLMRSQNVAGQGGEEALGRITATGDLRQNIGVPLEKIALGKDEEGAKTSALLSGISFEAEKDFTARLEIVRKRSEELQKLLLEHNPVGKITEQYQVEFEKLGLMLADLTGKTGKELNDIEQQVMAKYLQVGKDAYKFDISTDEGLAAFRAYLENIEGFRDRLRDIAAHENEEGAARLSDVLRGIYYQSYTYAEQYEEAISKLIQRNQRAWERAWKQQSEYKNGLALSSELEQVEKLMKRLEHYGFSTRVTLAQNIALHEQQLAVQGKMWANNVAQAQKELEAARENDEKEGTPASADAVTKAQAQLDAVSQMPDAVRTAIEELQNAMLSLQDATDSWVADMVSAFGKFMDGFVPFRSWYEDKGNLADNIFGTKEERQRAFGSFMDDLKKVLRQEMMERTRAAITRWALERKTSRMQKVEIDKQTDVSEKSNVAQEMGAKALGAAEIQVSNAITTAIMANSQKSTAQITADETQKATTGMWGNFGRAMTEAWAEGGPFMGAVLAAVVSAAVGGIITMVMNMIGHGSSTPTAPKTKLVSGMLTYDRGNVQSVASSTRPRVRTFDMGLIPVIGDDGRIYMAASESGSMPTGMVNRPTLTTIDGSPALVGERGPEMVIGRETTAAMQMYRPDLIQQIVEFDRNRSRGFARTFDTGTIAPAAEGQPALAGDSDLRDLLLTNQQLMAQMSAVNAALTEQLRKPIQAVINKHGAGGLIEETASGLLEARRAGNIKNVNRLFSRS